MKKKTLRRLELLLHILTISILALKGYDEITHRIYFPAFITFGLAATVLCVLFFWKSFNLTPRESRIICYYIEAPALLITSYMFYLDKKETVAGIALIATLLYPLVGFISTKKFKKLKKPA